MIDNVKKFYDVVKASSYENEKSIKILYENKFYTKAIYEGTKVALSAIETIKENKN